MPTSLDKLLEKLAPERIIDELSAMVDEALNTFPINDSRLSGSKMTHCLCRFVWHLENVCFDSAAPLPYDPFIYEGKLHALLEPVYGKDALLKASEQARLGLDGGLRDVLQNVGRAWLHRMTQEHVSLTVGAYWSGLTVTEQMAAMEEYLDKFGDILPPEFLDTGGIRAKKNFLLILGRHPFVLKELSKGGR